MYVVTCLSSLTFPSSFPCLSILKGAGGIPEAPCVYFTSFSLSLGKRQGCPGMNPRGQGQRIELYSRPGGRPFFSEAPDLIKGKMEGEERTTGTRH